MTDTHERTRARRDDHPTSIQAAKAVTAKAPNQRMSLLGWWALFGENGLTDEESAVHAGLTKRGQCPWKRAGELRADGLIRFDEDRTRKGPLGQPQRVSVITEAGQLELKRKGLA